MTKSNKSFVMTRKIAEDVATLAIGKALAKQKLTGDHKELMREVWKSNFSHGLDIIDQQCESPIEKQVAYALVSGFYAASPHFCHVPTHKAVRLMNGDTAIMDEIDEKFGVNGKEMVKLYSLGTYFWMVPNMWVSDKIRADFVITNAPHVLARMMDGKKTSFRDIKTMVIECDSFQWHGDREAFRKDKIRERQIIKLGYPVLRFSGAEIMADPVGIAKEVMDFMMEFAKR